MAGALFAKSGKPVAAVIVFEDPVPPGGSTSGEGSGSDCDPRQIRWLRRRFRWSTRRWSPNCCTELT